MLAGVALERVFLAMKSPSMKLSRIFDIVLHKYDVLNYCAKIFSRIDNVEKTIDLSH